jgi:SAM-dependent methyltransferase
MLAQFATGRGIDVGYGGDCISQNAWSFDMPQPYTKVGDDKQILRGDCRHLDFLCDESLDFVYQSHVIEDWTWEDIVPIINEWRRVLRIGGVLINCCPDEPVYSAHCRQTGQSYNENHKNADFTLENFKRKVFSPTGPWDIVYENPLINVYSWHLVMRKV